LAPPGKVAVLTMDVEDWYHLDYFDRRHCDLRRSLLDGLEVYRELIAREGLVSTYFVLGELAQGLAPLLRELAVEGQDVGSHGWDHRRPLTLPVESVAEDLRRSKAELEEVLQRPVLGYRAPCFSLDRPRLEAVRTAGYVYDSSRIEFGAHPLYGTLDLTGFEQMGGEIYRQGSFFEFEVSTLRRWGRQIPVSGGGYLRLLPWPVTRHLVKCYLKEHELYVLYIHPFELSRQPDPPLPAGTRWATRARFSIGRPHVADRLRRLIELLRDGAFRFLTFAQLRDGLGASEGAGAETP
jgi:polysaccharide deacetylase family protein (PEP-CTERM system associated)